jgi:hypothetical protein
LSANLIHHTGCGMLTFRDDDLKAQIHEETGILVAATLESVFACCPGRTIFATLVRAGVIPESVCEECAEIWSRDRPSRSS